jgi:GT2 family glycosyltransferase
VTSYGERIAESERPPLSVVVPSRDRPALLRPCLTHLRASLSRADQLIVADSASTDPAVEHIARDHGADCVRLDRPGASRARNAGWRKARHDLIAFVDDDVRVEPGWATGLATAFAAHPLAAFVTGRIVLPPGTPWTDVPIAIKEDRYPAVLRASTRGVIGHGANFAVRRSALERIGGFDERLGAGGDFRAQEDNDLWDRLFAAGFEGRFEPVATAWHEQWRRRRALLPLNWCYGIGSGARVAKLLHTDRRRAAGAARVAFWDWGLAELPRWLPRHRYAAALALVRVAGAAVGMVRVVPIRVVDGHLACP